MNSTTVINVDRLGKRFCKSHRNSMKYGMWDLFRKLSGKKLYSHELRPDEFWAVDEVSFELKEGQCLGILGPNGSGKSTLLKMLNGIIHPDKGEIGVNGKMAAMIEIGAGFHPMLTGKENIFINGAILGLEKKKIQKSLDEIISFSGLEEFINTPVKFYSSGMYVRLGFAIAAQLKPNILLIDEVLAVGDIQFRIKCIEHILKLQEYGTAIILVSHNTIDILKTATECIVMNRGKILFEGDAYGGVEEYHKLMLSYNSHEKNMENKGVFVGKVSVLNNEGRESRQYITGADLKLQIEVESNQYVNNARVIVAIEKPQFGEITSISNSYQDKVINLTPGTTKLELILESLPLLKGHYIVNVNVYGERREDFLDRVLGAANFEITGPELDYFGYGICGYINIKHQWNTSVE